MSKEQVKQLAKKYTLITALFAVQIALGLLNLITAGLSTAYNRMVEMKQISPLSNTHQQKEGVLSDEVPEKIKVVDSELHNSMFTDGSHIKNREVDYSLKPVPNCFGRAPFIPDCVPFIVYDNKEQVKSAVTHEVCGL